MNVYEQTRVESAHIEVLRAKQHKHIEFTYITKRADPWRVGGGDVHR